MNVAFTDLMLACLLGRVSLSDLDDGLNAEIANKDTQGGLSNHPFLSLASLKNVLLVCVHFVAAIRQATQRQHEEESDAGLPKLDHAR